MFNLFNNQGLKVQESWLKLALILEALEAIRADNRLFFKIFDGAGKYVMTIDSDHPLF